MLPPRAYWLLPVDFPLHSTEAITCQPKAPVRKNHTTPATGHWPLAIIPEPRKSHPVQSGAAGG